MDENKPEQKVAMAFGLPDFDEVTKKFEASFAELKDVLHQMLAVLHEINSKTGGTNV